MPPAFDLRDPEFLTNPAPVLARLRAEGDIVRARLPLIGEVWMTTTDAAARELLKDEIRFSRNPGRAGKRDITRYFWWLPPFLKPVLQNIILKDGADHARIRRLVEGAFARAPIDALRPEIAAIADALLDRIDPAQPVEIITAFTRELPLMVICAMLGVPEADRQKLARWISPISRPTNGLTLALALPGMWRVIRHFRRDFQIVRKTGRPGLIRELVRAEDAGDRLSEDELLSLVFTLFLAGHETTVHLITDAILGLIDAPAARDNLFATPADTALGVEEFLRFFSPVMMTKGMFATDDFEFRGTMVRRGDQFSALLIAANHDPARVDAPETLRPDRRPNAHLGFGFGPHVCLGMQLARAETQVALERLFSRFPDLQLAMPEESPPWSRRLGLRGVARLTLRLRPVP